MPDITISTEDKKAEPEKTPETELKDLLKAADEYKKIKEMNDKIASEVERRNQLIQLGGTAFAGQHVNTPEEQAEEEAKKLLSVFGK